jgi:hypothetical protein
MKKLRVKLNKDLLRYKAGRELNLEAVDGVPVLKYWRDRLKDAKIDNCIEIIKEKKKK